MLAVLLPLCLLSSSGVAPLALEPLRPKKPWQAIAFEGKQQAIHTYDLPQGVLCATDNEVILLDGRSGQRRWKAALPEGGPLPKLVASNEKAIAVNVGIRGEQWSDLVVILEPQSGRHLGEIRITEKRVSDGLAVQENELFLAYPDGIRCYSFDG